MTTPIPFNDRISCSVSEAIAVTSLGRTSLYGAIKDGDIESRVVRGRRLILVKSLRKFVEGDKASAPTPTPEHAA